MADILRRILVLILCAAWALPAASPVAMAQEQGKKKTAVTESGGPFPATPAYLTQMLIRYNTLDLSENTILDSVGMTVWCDVYQRLFTNEFEWQKFREAMRKSFALRHDRLPNSFYYIAKVRLDRYNPVRGAFEFPDRSILGFSELVLYDTQELSCGQARTRVLPVRYIASLRPPFKMPNLPVPAARARQTVENMLRDNNLDRYAWLRFTVEIADVMSFSTDEGSGEITVMLDARIPRMDFFDNEEGTRLVETYGYARAGSVRDRLMKNTAPPGPGDGPGLVLPGEPEKQSPVLPAPGSVPSE
ncbi:MAG: DUF4852 domain-containing protein [Pseudomonadota bacterium]|nr:DUF4852 domain-containing protein [Pseudomonadota bacterium]